MNKIYKIAFKAGVIITLATMTLLSLGFYSFFKNDSSSNISKKNIVVVGTGAAGIGFINEVVKNNYPANIIWISADNDMPYDRTKLDSIVSQQISANSAVVFKKAPKNVQLLLAKTVVSFDRVRKTIVVDDNKTYHYDYLFLATGSIPNPLSGLLEKGQDVKGIFNFYTLQDAKNIDNYIKQHSVTNAVVVGCGVNGLEVADALFKRGIRVTIIDRNEHILQNSIDINVSLAIEKSLSKIPLLKRCAKSSIKKIMQKNGVLEGIQLDNGSIVETPLMISTIGVKPNTKLLEKSGLTMEHGGLVVNNTMQTDDPSIYAGGNIVLVYDKGTNTITRSDKWGDGMKQGSIAASNILGKVKQYQGAFIGYRTSFFGNTLVMSGLLKDHPSHYKIIEELGLDNDGKHFYHKIILDGTIVKGFILFNNTRSARRLRRALEDKTPFNPRKRNS